jgi:hypothetical protein
MARPTARLALDWPTGFNSLETYQSAVADSEGRSSRCVPFVWPRRILLAACTLPTDHPTLRSWQCLLKFTSLPRVAFSADHVNFGSIAKGDADLTRTAYIDLFDESVMPLSAANFQVPTNLTFSVIGFGKVRPGSRSEGKCLFLHSVQGKPFKILSVVGDTQQPSIAAAFGPNSSDQHVVRVAVCLPQDAASPVWSGKIRIKTDEAAAPLIEVDWSAVTQPTTDNTPRAARGRPGLWENAMKTDIVALIPSVLLLLAGFYTARAQGWGAVVFDLCPVDGAALQQNQTAMKVGLGVCLCPSDRQPPVPGYGRVNYRFSLGPTHRWAPGAPFPESATGPVTVHYVYTPADFRDGLSNTVGASERLQGNWLKGSFKLGGDYLLGLTVIAFSV